MAQGVGILAQLPRLQARGSELPTTTVIGKLLEPVVAVPGSPVPPRLLGERATGALTSPRSQLDLS